MDERRLLEIIKERSRIFDLETGGTDPRLHPLVEGGVYDLKKVPRRTVFTHGLRDQSHWQPLNQEEFLASLSNWSRQKFESGQPWEPFLAEPKQMPADWLRRNITRPVSKGSWLWAHNARFDLKFMAANLTPRGYNELVTSPVGNLLSPGVVKRQRLHVTAGKKTFEYVQMAMKNPREGNALLVKSWPHFMETLEQAAANPQQGLLLDTQYVMQAALAHAREAKLMRPSFDLATGTSLEAYRTAFQRSFAGPAHTVIPDIRATASLLHDYMGLIGDIRQQKPLSPRQQRALRFHEELPPLLFPENTYLSFLKARQNLLQDQPFELTSVAGEQKTSRNLRELLGIYKYRRTTYGYEGADIEGIYAKVSRMNLSQVEEELLRKDERLQKILQKAWQAAEEPSSRGFGRSTWQGQAAGKLFTKIRNNPIKTLGVGLGAVLTGMALWPGGATQDEEPLSAGKNTIQNKLDPRQYAGLVRQLDQNKINHYRTNGY